MTYPSVVETFGIPPLEAMACGTPVVASDRTSVPEICGDAAVLVDPDDVDAYAAALHRALHDESLRAILVAKGRARVAHFDWRRAADGTLDLLEEAAGRGPAR
jgi:glycosyltransferase involved in cell wall biosynthesis